MKVDQFVTFLNFYFLIVKVWDWPVGLLNYINLVSQGADLYCSSVGFFFLDGGRQPFGLLNFINLISIEKRQYYIDLPFRGQGQQGYVDVWLQHCGVDDFYPYVLFP